MCDWPPGRQGPDATDDKTTNCVTNFEPWRDVLAARETKKLFD